MHIGLWHEKEGALDNIIRKKFALRCPDQQGVKQNSEKMVYKNQDAQNKICKNSGGINNYQD